MINKIIRYEFNAYITLLTSMHINLLHSMHITLL